MVAGGCIGYDEIRSMSRRHASYWNAFLCLKIIGIPRSSKHGFKLWCCMLEKSCFYLNSKLLDCTVKQLSDLSTKCRFFMIIRLITISHKCVVYLC